MKPEHVAAKLLAKAEGFVAEIEEYLGRTMV